MKNEDDAMATKQNTTQNIVIPNNDLEVLKKSFPHCFDKDGEFDFEKFKKELSDNKINFSKESYGMDWLGKSYARLLAADPAMTLLKEDKEWNSKEENKKSENVLIKGDNLEVLKHLSNAYHEKVKMIYIDPPYNTGSDGFVYEDDRKFTAQEFSELAGVDEEQAKKILSFVNSKSNSHSAWLTFMYPRLYIAKQLLRDDGVIFVSIDDNEVAQLRILMDEIFGEENFVGCFSWRKKTGSNDAKTISVVTEPILLYSKNKTYSIEKKVFNKNIESRDIDRYKLEDQFVAVRGRYYLDTLDRGGLGYISSLDFGIEAPNGKFIFPNDRIEKTNDGWRWKWGEAKVKWGLANSYFEFVKDPKKKVGYSIKLKTYEKVDNDLQVRIDIGQAYSSLILDYINTQGVDDLKKIFNDQVYFTNPKPVNLIKYLLKTIDTKDSIILDFFAGSGTTGDAVMQLNAEDEANGKKGGRTYILVQLPESIDPEKNKTAYDFVKNELGIAEATIFEITKERLLRAGKKIQAENIDQPAKSEKIKCEGFADEHCASCKGEHTVKIDAKKAQDLSSIDFGFKIFETMPIWEDYEFEAKEFDVQTKLFDESKLSDEDLQTILITWKTYDNIALTESLESVNLDGYVGYYGNGRLYLMSKGFGTKQLKALLNKIDEDTAFNPVSVIVFGYYFESKVLREIAENISNYANKKRLDIDFITRY